MKDAHFAASIDPPTLERVLKADKRLPALGAKVISLAADRQLLRVQVEFDRSFSADDVELDPAIEKVIAEVKPNIKGTISVYLGITSDPAAADEDTLLTAAIW
jgi:hypothetical protein